MNTTTTKAAAKPVEIEDVKAEANTEALSAEIAALRRDFQALIDQVGAAGVAAKDAAKATAKAKVAQGVEVGEHVAADLIEDWREIDRKVVAATRESPWRTLGAAAMVGLILGLILRR